MLSGRVPRFLARAVKDVVAATDALRLGDLEAAMVDLVDLPSLGNECCIAPNSICIPTIKFYWLSSSELHMYP